MCYCDKTDEEVIEDFIFETNPDESLLEDCCWRHICAVRGRHPQEFDAPQWRELCRRRGLVASTALGKHCQKTGETTDQTSTLT